jgi:hypothetical protein
MAQTTITNDDIAALASKLDAMADRFDEHERAALHAVFHLAGAAMSDVAIEVEGYGQGATPTSFSVTSDTWNDRGTFGESFDGGLLQSGGSSTRGASLGDDGSVTIEFTR